MNEYERRANHDRRESQESAEVAFALLRERVEQMDKHLEAQDRKIYALEHERDRALRWGIGSLGVVVITMGTFIWNWLIAGHK